jgi:aspartyl-tRNA(Asn)/glutamyl-tRNA(Gln) amidotransferase subunit A
VSEEVLKIYEETCRILEKNGANLTAIDMPTDETSLAAYYVISSAEVSSNLNRFDGIRFTQRSNANNLNEIFVNTRTELIGLEVKRRILLGTYVLTSGAYDSYYLQACKVRKRILNKFEELFKDVDFLLTPVSVSTAPKVSTAQECPEKEYLNDLYTIPASLAGLPSASIPAGLGSTSLLPVGIQVIAPVRQDRFLIETCLALEEILGTSNFCDRRKQ